MRKKRAARKRDEFLREIKLDVYNVFLGLVLAIAIYFVLGIVLGTSDPIVTVVSNSMDPTLHVGDLLILKGVDPNNIQEGMIVVYENPELGGRLVVHRVYEVYPDGTFRTKGDNNVTNPRPDPWIVKPSEVKGVVVFRIPYLGYPKYILSRLLGRV